MSEPEKINSATDNTTEIQSVTGHPLPEPGAVRLNRRNFVGKTIAGAGVVLGAELGYAGFKLLATKPVGERKPVQLNLAQLPEGSRTTVLYGGSKVEVMRTEKGIKRCRWFAPIWAAW